MDLTQHLRRHFEEGIELRRQMAETMPAAIARAGTALAQALKGGRKVLACGNGPTPAPSVAPSNTEVVDAGPRPSAVETVETVSSPATSCAQRERAVAFEAPASSADDAAEVYFAALHAAGKPCLDVPSAVT